MGDDNKQNSDGSFTTIDDELKEWPESAYTTVAQATVQGQQLNYQKQQNRRWLLLGGGAFLLIGILAALFFFFRADPSEVAKSQNPSNIQVQSNQTSPTIPVTIENLQNSQLKVGDTNNNDNYSATESIVTSNDKDILKVIKYEFYSGKFIYNNTALKDEQDLIATLKGLSGSLNNSWIIIFASASLEGDKDYNLKLCRERLYAIKSMLEGIQINSRSYSGILAGEYKLATKFSSGREEEEEEKIAKEKGEKWLSEQRRLIIITIRELAPIEPKAAEVVPQIVAKNAFDKGMLPYDYDIPRSKPFKLQGKVNK